MSKDKPNVDLVTIVGLALLMMPLMTMWHEIGGHALICKVQGGRVEAIGAFYVNCDGLSRWPHTLVALAGPSVDALLALVVYVVWRRATGGLLRLVLWYLWVSKAFVVAGYVGFSGVSGFGDLAPSLADGDGLGPVPYPVPFRIAEVIVAVAVYFVLVRQAIATLAGMIGTGPSTRQARRRIAHGFYGVCGIAAVVIGLANPLGFVITLLSAAASSFGGLAGFISIGFAEGRDDRPRAFSVARHWPVVAAGAIVLAFFAVVLGPTWHP